LAVPLKQNVAVTKKTASKAAKAAPKKKRPGSKARAEAVKRILKKVETQMSAKNVKASLGDYIRLIQLSKEMTDEPKTEIKVGWIEEPESSSIEE
jgi:hypothetical protein